VAHTDVVLDDMWTLDLVKLDGWKCVRTAQYPHLSGITTSALVIAIGIHTLTILTYLLPGSLHFNH